ncbi:MAG: four helix bundle protein [FCB group bacterium]|nr:four helix bundle protein [FCB group bacterium]MBL7028820.1 four helix bundle protein [Candidatus Neomarinimicrobiota bacterium]MBL7121725.1 four helix bundle protein [Candidatus Neomarinimicrobiota bacterium]
MVQTSRGKITHFTDLVVWQEAHALVLEVYALIEKFPEREKFALVQQLIRASVSIPANIAEGFRRRTKPEKIRFYNIAQASLAEVTYFFILAKDLKYITSDHREQIDLLDKKLTRLIQSIQK